MTEKNDWDSRASEVQQDQINAYDQMRRRCPVAYDDYLGYSLFRHQDVMTVLQQPDIYSNAVSTRHIAVPNGMDVPLHTAFRKINDKYFTPERMQAFEPKCRQVIRELLRSLPRGEDIEIMQHFAKPYAMRIQNAFMGWPAELEEPLGAWIEKNRRVTLAQDRVEIAKVALEFDSYIHDLLQARRDNPTEDVTTELLHDIVELPEGNRTMTEEELISLIRNWTVGELSTISASADIIIKFLAENPAEQQRLRADVSEIPAAVEEIMRLEDPLVTNRRLTTCPVHLGGRDIPENARITINWASANRDEAVFPEATQYRPQRSQQHNLVYGAGIHACPGAPLARLELRLLTEELLSAFNQIRPSGTHRPFSRNAVYPVSGYAEVFVRFEQAPDAF